MAIDGYGPYQFFNTIPTARPDGIARAAVVLRTEFHLRWDAEIETTRQRTDDSSYHGRGWLYEELSALASLALGTRLKAGNVTREFLPHGDPRGRPQEWRTIEQPRLLVTAEKPILRRATGSHSLDDLAPLRWYPQLETREAIALVRAARLYQDGLWIVESDSQLTWLLLVSAIETAANHWRPGTEAPLDRLQSSLPGLETILRENGDDQFVERVATLLAPYLGATRKFVEFVLRFLPPPPLVRASFAQHPWEPKAMKRSLEKIYNYRSQALHGGKPFPAPMCMAPFGTGEPLELAETSWSLATRTAG